MDDRDGDLHEEIENAVVNSLVFAIVQPNVPFSLRLGERHLASEPCRSHTYVADEDNCANSLMQDVFNPKPI